MTSINDMMSNKVREVKEKSNDKFINFNGHEIIFTDTGNLFFITEKDNNPVYLEIAPNNKGQFTYQWKVKQEDKFKALSVKMDYKLLDQRVKSRDQLLVESLNERCKIPKDKIESFIKELGIFLSDYKEEFSFDEESEEQELELNQPQGFDDYSDNTKAGALHVVQNRDPLDFFKRVVGSKHIGDDKEVEICILQQFTNRVLNGEPVHIDMGGDSDSGKTDLVNTVLDIIPERFQQSVSSLSAKSLYYDETVRNDFNHFVIDDYADENDDVLGLLKVATDNRLKRKIHKTIIDGKFKEYEIPGRNVFSITAAKDISEIELQRRHLKLNPEQSDEHKTQVKGTIAESEVSRSGDPELLFEIAKAVYEKLTERQFMVFNPFIGQIDIKDKGNTDIKIISALIKARTVIYQNTRTEITEGVLLGTKEDVEAILSLWKSIGTLQQYKINKKDMELVTKLPFFDEEYYDSYIAGLSNNSFDLIDSERAKGLTYKELAETMKVSKSWVQERVNAFNSKQRDPRKMGLLDMGLVITRTTNPEHERAAHWLYANPDKKKLIEGWKSDNDLTILNINSDSQFINDSIGKWKLIGHYLNYLSAKHISPTYMRTPIIEELPEEFNTDEEVLNILQIVNKEIENLPEEAFYKESSTSLGLIDNLYGQLENPINDAQNKNPDNDNQPDSDIGQESQAKQDKEETRKQISGTLFINAYDGNIVLNPVERNILEHLAGMGNKEYSYMVTDWAIDSIYSREEIIEAIEYLMDLGAIGVE